MESGLRIRQYKDIAILDLRGDVLTHPKAEILDETARLLHAGKVKIALNLTEIGHVSSRGLADLAKVHFDAQKANGQLRLIIPSQRIKQVFAITHLASFFEIVETESEALASFK